MRRLTDKGDNVLGYILIGRSRVRSALEVSVVIKMEVTKKAKLQLERTVIVSQSTKSIDVISTDNGTSNGLTRGSIDHMTADDTCRIVLLLVFLTTRTTASASSSVIIVLS